MFLLSPCVRGKLFLFLNVCLSVLFCCSWSCNAYTVWSNGTDGAGSLGEAMDLAAIGEVVDFAVTDVYINYPLYRNSSVVIKGPVTIHRLFSDSTGALDLSGSKTLVTGVTFVQHGFINFFFSVMLDLSADNSTIEDCTFITTDNVTVALVTSSASDIIIQRNVFSVGGIAMYDFGHNTTIVNNYFGISKSGVPLLTPNTAINAPGYQTKIAYNCFCSLEAGITVTLTDLPSSFVIHNNYMGIFSDLTTLCPTSPSNIGIAMPSNSNFKMVISDNIFVGYSRAIDFLVNRVVTDDSTLLISRNLFGPVQLPAANFHSYDVHINVMSSTITTANINSNMFSSRVYYSTQVECSLYVGGNFWGFDLGMMPIANHLVDAMTFNVPLMLPDVSLVFESNTLGGVANGLVVFGHLTSSVVSNNFFGVRNDLAMPNPISHFAIQLSFQSSNSTVTRNRITNSQTTLAVVVNTPSHSIEANWIYNNAIGGIMSTQLPVPQITAASIVGPIVRVDAVALCGEASVCSLDLYTNFACPTPLHPQGEIYLGKFANTSFNGTHAIWSISVANGFGPDLVTVSATNYQFLTAILLEQTSHSSSAFSDCYSLVGTQTTSATATINVPTNTFATPVTTTPLTTTPVTTTLAIESSVSSPSPNPQTPTPTTDISDTPCTLNSKDKGKVGSIEIKGGTSLCRSPGCVLRVTSEREESSQDSEKDDCKKVEPLSESISITISKPCESKDFSKSVQIKLFADVSQRFFRLLPTFLLSLIEKNMHV
eukprot:TRINITY_DN1656_c1_g1_i6.p1 TRINITY_DN1656_c1_g1~~TRINITY_DN1656_c1_g1_i6.p1  ORF type:complete len:808 (+),score=74.30 TRINITY_DN1656_c1_g1_i6:126-2426(+)